ncbi:hypothetical protein ILUMI_14541, partial [Ignelater luminosus]
MDELIEGKKKLYQKWLNTKDQEDYRKFSEIKRETKRKIIESKRETWDKKRQEIETYIGGRKCSEVWKFINKVKTNETPRSPLQLIPVREWVKTYEDLLTEQKPEYTQITPTKIRVEGEEIYINTEE